MFRNNFSKSQKRLVFEVAVSRITEWANSDKSVTFYDRFFDSLLLANEKQKIKMAGAFPEHYAAFEQWEKNVGSKRQAKR